MKIGIIGAGGEEPAPFFIHNKRLQNHRKSNSEILIDVAEDILTEFHPWMKSAFFEADHKLTELSKNAVAKILPRRY